MSGGGPVDEEKRTTLRQFAALGAISPLAHFTDGDFTPGTKSDARNAIIGYLAATPGAHFSKIRDDLSLGTGETQHHLRQLNDAHVVESHRDGEYRRYFLADRFSPFDKLALGYLRRDTARAIIIALLRDPELSGSELAASIGVSGATVSKYVNELETVGLLDRQEGYRIVRPETVISLLIRHADSFDTGTVSFANHADELITYDP